MKILTWNIVRPKKANQLILEKLAQYNSDIVVLTEPNAISNSGKESSYIDTDTLIKDHYGIDYQTGENRTTI